MVQTSARGVRGLAALALLTVLALGGCAAQGPGVASLDDGGADATTEPDTADRDGDPVKFAECMRDQGIEMEDPDVEQGGDGEGGGFAITIPQGADREEMDSAMDACKEFLPDGGEPPKLDPEAQAKMRAFAECMRRNGVEEFPDPEAGGGIMIDGDAGALDPSSEEFKAAQEACRGELPEMPGAPDDRTGPRAGGSDS